MRKLQIEYIHIDNLTPYERNARKHTPADVAAIKNSIAEFGMNDPIGVWGEKNIIVEGHGRLAAAKELGLTELPCLRLDRLTDEQRRAYAIAHNKTAELSAWDDELLQIELDDIGGIDMELFGFELDEIGIDPGEVDEDEIPEVDEVNEPITKHGDIWLLGDHRLLCGDSTSIDDLNKLLDGDMVDLVVTDPPYNMAYEGAGKTPDKKRKQNRILNDNMSDEAFDRFLTECYTTMYAGMKDGASFYVFYKELGKGVFITALEHGGLTFKQELIWVKNSIVLGGSKYQNMYEPFLFGCKGKRIANWYGERKQRSVIEAVDLIGEIELREAIKDLLECYDTDVIRERKTLVNDLHPTMKPIKLLAKLIANSSKTNDMVLDLFGGSGSTLIACEQMRRRCRMIELDPKYCDVIIKRWETLTGQKAVRISH